jgi:hypothetical protein
MKLQLTEGESMTKTRTAGNEGRAGRYARKMYPVVQIGERAYF